MEYTRLGPRRDVVGSPLGAASPNQKLIQVRPAEMTVAIPFRREEHA